MISHVVALVTDAVSRTLLPALVTDVGDAVNELMVGKLAAPASTGKPTTKRRTALSTVTRLMGPATEIAARVTSLAARNRTPTPSIQPSQFAAWVQSERWEPRRSR